MVLEKSLIHSRISKIVGNNGFQEKRKTKTQQFNVGKGFEETLIRNGLMFLFNLGTKMGLNVKLLYEFNRKNIKGLLFKGG